MEIKKSEDLKDSVTSRAVIGNSVQRMVLVNKTRACGPSATPHLDLIGAKEIQMKVNQAERDRLEKTAWPSGSARKTRT